MILVTGGAGYIGSHACAILQNRGIGVVAVDNLSKGYEKAVKCKLYVGDLRDSILLDKIFSENKIDGVIHFAANSLVGESMKIPLVYYDNNVFSAINLLNAMVKYNVKNIVFSSTASTYGIPKNDIVSETDVNAPINTYGETKLAIEKMLKWCNVAYGIKYTILRYFNVAGALSDGSIGEAHDPETHLIPIVLKVALGQNPVMKLFGDDYNTADGTCIRDYIHVEDLIEAHLLALEYLKNDVDNSDIFNLGNGFGFSNKQIVEASRLITGHPIPTVIEARRPGDPDVLVASSEKAKRILGWTPKITSIEQIISSAWNWHSKNPNGYK